LIFNNYALIPFSENYIKQLHQELLRFSEKDGWHRGNYKTSPNHVEAFNASGKSLGIVFETASPFQTPLRMERLIGWIAQATAERKLHPLLMIAVFVVEFLAIHPFQDGNGRLSRVLTTFLLLKYGYLYVPYSSLEAVIEYSKENYFLALRQTQGTLASESPNWQPWISFFLSMLLQQKARLESKLEMEMLLIGPLPELSLKILELARTVGRVTVRSIFAVTSANRNTIKKHLGSLVEKKHLQQEGTGKGTWYRLTGSSAGLWS
jgi:Fic family protein